MDDPNVLCISIDSLRADFVPFLSGDCETMPFLSTFAERSTIFNRAFSPSIWTLPVHMSVFTGLYPFEHQVLDKSVDLGDHPTLAKILSANRYKPFSAYRNSWFDVGDVLRGFGDESGETTAGDDAVRGIRDVAWKALTSSPGVVEQTVTSLIGLVRPSRDQQVLVDALSSIEATEQPFFGFVHFNEAHYTYDRGVLDGGQFTDQNLLARLWNCLHWQEEVYKNREKTWAGEMSPPEKEVETFKNLYRESIRTVDSLIEQLITTLEKSGTLEDTIVVIFGDHGDEFGDNGVFGHHFSLSNALTHVPFVVFDPTGHLETGQRNDIVQIHDIYPTLLDVLDIDGPETNTVSLLKEGAREYAFTHYEYTDALSRDAQAAIEDVGGNSVPPRKQLCVNSADGRRLVYYPEEDNYGDIDGDRKDLETALQAHQDSLCSVSTKRDEGVSQSVEQNLKEMGYL